MPSQSLKNTLFHYPQAIAANLFFGSPSHDMNIVGITGTDGKTTTTTGIYHLFTTAGHQAAMFTTVQAMIADQTYDTGLHTTTPSPWLIQKLLSQARGQGVAYAAIEATSHGLSQHRLWGIPFKIGIVTNITHDHLDYHKNYANYLYAKAQLFNQVKYAILNRDDQSFEPLNAYLQDNNSAAMVITYSIEEPAADLHATHIKPHDSGTRFTLKLNTSTFPGYKDSYEIDLPLIGEFNVSNALCVAATGFLLNFSEIDITTALNTYPSVAGRQEHMVIKGRDIYIDFAHTPNAIDCLLKTLKSKLPQGKKLITVFGATGERDHDKRPIMGEVASTLADRVILTSDDTRSEDPQVIINQILPGCSAAGATIVTPDKFIDAKNDNLVTTEADRAKAFHLAAQASNPGDIIALLGKGHEKSILIGSTEHPWSERVEIEKSFTSLE